MHHFPCALIFNAEVQLVEIALQIRGRMHGTGKGIILYYTRTPQQRRYKLDEPCEAFGHAWLKPYDYFEILAYEKYIFLCVIKLAKILDFHSIFTLEPVYIDHIICTQFRWVIISPLFSLELPNLWLISSAIKRSQFPRMTSCFIYTNRHVPYKNFHNIQNGKWLLSHPILLSKIIFRGLCF